MKNSSNWLNIKIATDSQKISERTNLEEGIIVFLSRKIFNFTSVQKNVKITLM